MRKTYKQLYEITEHNISFYASGEEWWAEFERLDWKYNNSQFTSPEFTKMLKSYSV